MQRRTCFWILDVHDLVQCKQAMKRERKLNINNEYNLKKLLENNSRIIGFERKELVLMHCVISNKIGPVTYVILD